MPPANVRREIFVRSPGPGIAVMAYAYAVDRRGRYMISIEQHWSRSDTIDQAFLRGSEDFGMTWPKIGAKTVTGEKRAGGMWRKHPRGVWVDPVNGRAIDLWNEGTLENDDPLEGLRQWRIFAKLPNGKEGPIVHTGRGFNPEHPLPGVFLGKNSAMLGDQTCRPIRFRDEVLLPVSIASLGKDGALANPGGGYTYQDTAVLHGKWSADAIEWRMSELIAGDPARSTRGMSEATIAEIADRRVLCVMRGSNDKRPELPGYKWYSISRDGGWRWSKPQPWTDTQGRNFFSPSSCSQLLAHSTGRLYWIGNWTEENPRGNRPRYPLAIAEVDLRSGLVLRESARAIDTLGPGEDPVLSISNFYAREDPWTRDLCVHATRLFAKPDAPWVGDAYLYRVTV
ncbi:MAG: sialidase family protein [Bryobacteraceae bacterium]|nr:sialidase family protein [Bryobacteraceae bacterium]